MRRAHSVSASNYRAIEAARSVDTELRGRNNDGAAEADGASSGKAPHADLLSSLSSTSSGSDGAITPLSHSNSGSSTSALARKLRRKTATVERGMKRTDSS